MKFEEGRRTHPLRMAGGVLALLATIGLWRISPALVRIFWGVGLLDAFVWTIEERGRTAVRVARVLPRE